MDSGDERCSRTRWTEADARGREVGVGARHDGRQQPHRFTTSLRLIGGSESLVSQGPLPPPWHGTQPASDAGNGALDGFLHARRPQQPRAARGRPEAQPRASRGCSGRLACSPDHHRRSSRPRPLYTTKQRSRCCAISVAQKPKCEARSARTWPSGGSFGQKGGGALHAPDAAGRRPIWLENEGPLETLCVHGHEACRRGTLATQPCVCVGGR